MFHKHKGRLGTPNVWESNPIFIYHHCEHREHYEYTVLLVVFYLYCNYY